MNADKKENRSIRKIPDVYKEVESLYVDTAGGRLEFFDTTDDARLKKMEFNQSVRFHLHCYICKYSKRTLSSVFFLNSIFLNA